jgi:hypothetical protein
MPKPAAAPGAFGDAEPCDPAEGQGRDSYPSPNGAYWATADGRVRVSQGGPCARLVHPKWVRFVGWTGDSRYAVYAVEDQYGNGAGLVFDTVAWRQFALPQAIGLGDPRGRAGDSPRAVSQPSNRVLLGKGTLLRLPDRVLGNLLEGTGQSGIYVAAWSPDDRYVAFAASAGDFPTSVTVYVWRDGAAPRALDTTPFVSAADLRIGWSGAREVTLGLRERNEVYTLAD